MWVATLANVILMITLCMSAFAVDVPLVTSTEYPHGHDNHVVTTDPLGVQTTSRKFYDSTCKIEETISAGVTNRLIRIHNGAEITEKYWNNKALPPMLWLTFALTNCRLTRNWITVCAQIITIR